MEFHSIKTPIITQKDDLVKVLVNSLNSNNLKLENKNILIFAETVVGTTQGRIIEHNDIKSIEPKANELAKSYKMDPVFVQIILNEADTILGGVEGVLLTEKDGVLIANAGVDQSNSGGPDKYSLFPDNPSETAYKLWSKIKEKFGLNELGIIIADSRVQPMKRGVIGVAIGVAGFEPIEDYRGRKDLFGMELTITTKSVADDLTSAAEILMGEADEQIPIVLVKNAPVIFTTRKIDSSEMIMPQDQCLFMNVFKDLAAYKKPIHKKEN